MKKILAVAAVSVVVSAVAYLTVYDERVASTEGNDHLISSNEPASVMPMRSVAGTVVGLAGSGLILGVTARNDCPIHESGFFSCEVPHNGEVSYGVSIKAQPSNPAQTCTVSGDASTDGKVTVTCSPSTKQIGAAGAKTHGNAVAVDALGNVIVAGYSNGGLDGNKSRATGLFVTKYSPAGKWLYTKQFGESIGVGEEKSSTDYYISMTTDSAGNVIVAGATSAEFEGIAPVGDWDYFLLKLDAKGNPRFTKVLGGFRKRTLARAVATDADNTIYVVGDIVDENNSTHSGFIARFDANGKRLENREFGGGDVRGEIHDVAADAGNIVALGRTDDPWGVSDEFIALLNGLDDVPLYTTFLSEYGTNEFNVIAVDKQHNIIVAGSTWKGIDDDTRRLQNEMFLMKFDGAGNLLFRKQTGITGLKLEVTDVLADGHGNIFIVGYTDQEMEMADNKQDDDLDDDRQVGDEALFLVKFDPEGNLVWSKRRTERAQATSVAIAPNGNIFLTGVTSSGLDGNSRKGTWDAFLMKYDTDGNLQ